jgi:ABC-type sugar transport system ATPase subunit
MSDRVAVMHEGAMTGMLARGECTEERIMTLAVG